MSDLLLICMIAGRRAALPATRVASVIEIESVTPIPMAPPFIAGLTALRSQALTVIDCRVSLGFAPSTRVIGSRAAVVDHEGHRYALLLDDAFDVERALSEPATVPGGFGDGWERAAIGLVECESGPAVMIAIEEVITGPVHREAA